MNFSKSKDLSENPPGPIDNLKLEKMLIIESNEKQLKENKDYYLINQKLWEFFFNIYSGGPTICK